MGRSTRRRERQRKRVMRQLSGLGERLRQVRSTRTQRAFAQIHKTSQGYISDLERDKAQPSFHLLISLVSKEGISLDWLFTGKGEQQGSLLNEITDPLTSGSGSQTFALGKETTAIYQELERLLNNPELPPSLADFLASLLGKKRIP